MEDRAFSFGVVLLELLTFFRAALPLARERHAHGCSTSWVRLSDERPALALPGDAAALADGRARFSPAAEGRRGGLVGGVRRRPPLARSVLVNGVTY